MINELISNIRKEEINEVYASDGIDIETAIKESISSSLEYYPIGIDDNLLGIAGIKVFDILHGISNCWILTTNNVDKYPITFVKRTKFLLDYWSTDWPILFNYIDYRYKKSLKWANMIGFKIYDPEPFGYLGLPFCKIVKERK